MVGVGAFLTIGAWGVNRVSPSTSVCCAAGRVGGFAGIRKRLGVGRLTMPEFMFRNLSVKLYPAGGDAGQACGAGTSQQAVFRNFGGCWNGCSAPATYVRVFCDPDSHIQLCGDATTFLCDWPSRPACDPPSPRLGFHGS